jgi:hypothetical protein
VVPALPSTMSLGNTYPFLLRKENKTKFFFPAFPPSPLPSHLLHKCVSSVLKTHPQKYEIDIEMMDIHSWRIKSIFCLEINLVLEGILQNTISQYISRQKEAIWCIQTIHLSV